MVKRQVEPTSKATVRLVTDISSLDKKSWDDCANPPDLPYNPFISHTFLAALEQSNSVGPGTGWMPQHLVLEDEQDQILAAMPCYLKSHSLGEYVFDQGWAEGFERAGGHYYPKLLSAVPFTPVTGRRLLVPLCNDPEARQHILLNAAKSITQRLNLSSIHINFLPKKEWERAAEEGYLLRRDQQFHWNNQGFETFDDFLSTLSARKRKAIRKERKAALDTGIKILWLTGDELNENHFDAFFQFYMDTGERKWGDPYLTRDFFSRILATMADEILLLLCMDDNIPIAGALNFIGSNTLYGRYWGAIEHHKFLHFETCYYQAIDFAIDRKLDTVEAGAQGAHKLARGYLPKDTYSAHFITHESLRRAVSDYLARENIYIDMENEALMAHSPFAKTCSNDDDQQS